VSADNESSLCIFANQYAARVRAVPRTWIWMQAAIVVFVVAGMVIAITKLA
jgi:hypothetical protein